MDWKLRPVGPDDYEAVTMIRNQIRPEPMTVAEMVDADRARFNEPAYIRLVAERDGKVVAHGWTGANDGLPEGMVGTGVQVDRAHRGQGAGEALLVALEEHARAGGAQALEAMIRGEDDASYEWALKRGYYLYRQRTEATLDLTTFDPSPFAGAIERATGTDVTFIGHDGLLPDPLLRGAYEVDKATTADVPGYGDSAFPTYEKWVSEMEPYFTRTYFVLAMDGERVVGLSTLERSGQGDGATTGMTGVLREYRGRGIALALKLQSIAEAQRLGLIRMRTNNDPDNPPMLAVNRKLGYVFIPGPRRMRKNLG
ncbi:MAG TPA: GNAT family N-acetyltransferase [Symbiobacteriaceae bacterium]|nr:GNAT family N-acetyltransferase [Symbiobacteriaceae bacterium]